MTRGTITRAAAIGLLVVVSGGTAALAQAAAAEGSSSQDAAAFVHEWDRSEKGRIDLRAMLDAGMAKFETLDKDHRGVLTQEELAGVLTPEAFAQANPDHDDSIGAQEWLDLVQRRFYAAGYDDGMLTAKDESQKPAGKALIKLPQRWS